MDKKTSTYEESDFVDVVDENGVALDPIPKQWLGTDLVRPGVKKAGKDAKTTKAEPKVVEIPDGPPAEAWTHDQLDAYASKQEPPVDVSGASNKDEKLALLVAATQVA